MGPSWAILGHLWAILGDPGPIFGPSWASLAPLLGSLGAVLGPCCAISVLSGRLLGLFFAISEPHPTLIDHSGRIWGHLGAVWGHCCACLAPCGQISKPILNHLGAHVGTSSSLNPPTVRKYQKGGRRCIAAGVLDDLSCGKGPFETSLLIAVQQTLAC